MEPKTTSSLSKSIPQFPNVLIKGKIVKIITIDGKNGNIYGHLVNTPAIDQFSHPGGAYVKSKTRLGNEGEMVEVEVKCLRSSYNGKKGIQYNHDFWPAKELNS